MIYGLYPSGEVSRSVQLKPAMTLKTRVSFVKVVPPDTPIGYGQAFI
jgi:alanine racemase